METQMEATIEGLGFRIDLASCGQLVCSDLERARTKCIMTSRRCLFKPDLSTKLLKAQCKMLRHVVSLSQTRKPNP